MKTRRGPEHARGALPGGWRAGALVAALILLAAGCGRSDPERPRAAVIGIDGADWAIVDALVAEGRMPQLQALRERGTWGPIETLADVPLSPVIWTSVATGKTPAKHEIAWFLVDQPDGSRVPVRSYNRRSKAIWNILGDRGLRAISLGWWASYPAEDVGKGLIVSDALGFHGFGRTAREGDDGRKTHPPSLFARVNALIPTEQQISTEFATRFLDVTAEEYRRERFDPARHPRRDPSNPIHLFQQYAVTAQGYTSVAEELLANEDFDLFLVYFEQIDSLSHLFMKYDPPKLEWVGDEEFARYRRTVREWYAYQDELLGRLLAHLDLDTTAVFVLSDHGFKTGERRIRSDRTVDMRKAHLEHEPHGIFVAAGPGIRRGVELADASVMDVTPTLLTYLGLPVGRDMDGKVLAAIFDEAQLAARPIHYIATYETADRSETAMRAPETLGGDDLRESLQALEALGYLASDLDLEEADTSSPEIHNNLGRIHLRGGEIDEARARFQQALSMDPRNADALLNLGAIERLRGNAVGAEHLVKRALQANPNSIAALVQLAELRRYAGDLPESIRLYREALAVDDSQPFVFLGLGDSLQRAGRYAEAETAFESVLELAPDSFEAHYNMGVTYFNERRLADATRHYEQALSLDPDPPRTASTLNNLASILLEQGRRGEAQARFEEAVAAGPRHLESRYNLATLYLQDGRIDEAIPLLEAGAVLAPNHEALHVTLGLAYLQKGRNHEAYRSFLLVRRLHASNWVAALGLAALHAASEQPEQARALLDEALALGGDAARARARAYPALFALLEEDAAAP